jgi:hypothetical protein
MANKSASSGRDDFPKTVVRALSDRVGGFCSNPTCKKQTKGPHTDDASCGRRLEPRREFSSYRLKRRGNCGRGLPARGGAGGKGACLAGGRARAAIRARARQWRQANPVRTRSAATRASSSRLEFASACFRALALELGTSGRRFAQQRAPRARCAAAGWGVRVLSKLVSSTPVHTTRPVLAFLHPSCVPVGYEDVHLFPTTW